MTLNYSSISFVLEVLPLSILTDCLKRFFSSFSNSWFVLLSLGDFFRNTFYVVSLIYWISDFKELGGL